MCVCSPVVWVDDLVNPHLPNSFLSHPGNARYPSLSTTPSADCPTFITTCSFRAIEHRAQYITSTAFIDHHRVHITGSSAVGPFSSISMRPAFSSIFRSMSPPEHISVRIGSFGNCKTGRRISKPGYGKLKQYRNISKAGERYVRRRLL